MDYLDKYDRLMDIILEDFMIDGKKYNLKEDFEKLFINDNKTAGIRIRRVMQELKKLSQEIREDVQNHKKNI